MDSFTERDIVEFGSYALHHDDGSGCIYHSTYMNWLQEARPDIFKMIIRDGVVSQVLKD